jgi:outer membrane protein assembly factor BamB
MKSTKKKINSISIALLLILTISIAVLPALAHDPAWKIPTFIYVTAMPNPVGVGQQVLVFSWLQYPFAGANVANDIRFQGVTITITKPDGKVENVEFPIVKDTTSSMYFLYTPDQVGTYKLVSNYKGQVYNWAGQAYQNDTFLPSQSEEFYLTVQEDQLPPPVVSTAGPTEYWTRPIEGQNTDWWNVSSNWLGTASAQLEGVWPNSLRYGRYIADGVGPETSHIMWTKPIQDGGVVGGENTYINGDVFYNGINYNARFRNPIIMYGRLFYELPWGNSGTGGGFMCVDLRTGETLWYNPDNASRGIPQLGQYINYHTPNQHGTIANGYLFTLNFAQAYDPASGGLTTFNITNVPSGTKDLGPIGEELRYGITNYGNTTHPNWKVWQWNSTNVIMQTGGGGAYTGGFRNASDAICFDWNASISGFGLGMSSPTITAAFKDDIILGRNGTMPSTSFNNILTPQTPFTEWAISLKPESRGRVLWMRDAYLPPDSVSLIQGVVDKNSRVYIWWHKETLKAEAFNLDTGQRVWGPTRFSGANDFWETDKYSQLAYSNLYYAGYEGIIYCIDMATGNLKWTYGNGGPGNSTASSNTNWGRWPQFWGAIVGGKLYTYSTEHSPKTPIYKDGKIRCIDAFDGTEIWTLTGYGGTHASNTQVAAAEGFLVFLNSYDMQIYSVGRGPSATTVSIQNDVISHGNSVLVKGTIMDIAAGTKQKEQTARFPNGVAAVSDDSMSDWMEYVYEQKPRPTDVSGVEVVVSVLDPNNNSYEVGRTTSDSNGMYKLMFTPEVPGEYTIIATFPGSQGYWPSQGTTALGVLEAPTMTTSQPTTQPLSVAEIYFIPAIAGLFIFVAIIGVAIILMLRKRL